MPALSQFKYPFGKTNSDRKRKDVPTIIQVHSIRKLFFDTGKTFKETENELIAASFMW